MFTSFSLTINPEVLTSNEYPSFCLMLGSPDARVVGNFSLVFASNDDTTAYCAF